MCPYNDGDAAAAAAASDDEYDDYDVFSSWLCWKCMTYVTCHVTRKWSSSRDASLIPLWAHGPIVVSACFFNLSEIYAVLWLKANNYHIYLLPFYIVLWAFDPKGTEKFIYRKGRSCTVPIFLCSRRGRSLSSRGRHWSTSRGMWTIYLRGL